MEILQVIGTIIVLFLLSGVFGLLFQAIFKKNDLLALFPEGFLFFLAIFQVTSTPLLIYHLPYRYAFILFIFLVAAGLVSLFILLKQGKINVPKPAFDGDKLLRVSLVLCIILVLGQAVVGTVYTFMDADDLYYVGLANTNIDAPSLYAFDPSTGNIQYPVISQYRFESYELILGIVADLSGLPTAGVFHTVLPFFLICLAYLAYAYLARQIVPGRMVPLLIILLSVFHIFGGYSPFSPGSYLLTRVWQGKSILLHIILPIIMGMMVEFYRQGYPRKMIAQTAIILIAGISVTPVAVFLPTTIIALYCGFFFLKQPRKVVSIGLMALSMIPLALYAWGIKSGVSASLVYATDKVIFEPLVIYESFLRTGWPYYAAYVLISLYYLWKGTFEERVIFSFSPLVLTVFVYNPLLAPIIAREITSYATFWRMLWLIPVGIGLGKIIIDSLRIHKAAFGVLLAIFLAFTISNHANLFEILVPPENVEKLPAEQVEIAHFLAETYGEKSMILSPEDIAVSVRQVDDRPIFFWSRQDYINEFTGDGKKNKDYKRRLELEAIFYYNEDMPAEDILFDIKDFDITVIVAPKSKPVVIEKLLVFDKVYETSNYVIFYNTDK